jgi:hypothetical protein
MSQPFHPFTVNLDGIPVTVAQILTNGHTGCCNLHTSARRAISIKKLRNSEIGPSQPFERRKN